MDEILSLELLLILEEDCLNRSLDLFWLGDNNLELDATLCLSSKKKSPSKKITGFQVGRSTNVLIHVSILYLLIFSMRFFFFLRPQYSAEDSSRIMVSSADSRIRIIEGLNVIQKYKGMHLSVLVCC